MLLVPHVLVGLLGLIQREDLLVHDGLDVVRLDRAVHLLELHPVAHQHAAHRADVVQALQERRLLLALRATKEADDADHAVDADRLQALRHRVRPADLEDVLHAAPAGRQLLRRLAPVRLGLVVDHVVRAERLELLALLAARRRGDDLRAGRFGKLHGEHAHAARALRQHPVAGLQRAALEPVQPVPRRQAGARQRAALQEVEVGRHAHEALLVVRAVLAQGAVDGAADAGRDAVPVEGAGEVRLVEEGQDFVAFGEAGHAAADGFDGAGAVGGGDHVGGLREGVEAFDDGQVAVVEGGAVDWVLLGSDFGVCVLVNRASGLTLDQDVLLADLRNGSVGGELEAVKAVGVGDGPLLHGGRHDCEYDIAGQ